jgi:6-phosphofructokinase 2
MASIVTMTVNPTIDKSCDVEHVVPDKKLRCSRPEHEPGGGGLNVSRAVKKMGGSSKAVYLCGGPTGIMLRELLEEENIDQHPLEIEDWTRQNLAVFETATSRQYRFGMPGPEIREDEWQRMLEALKSFSPAPSIIVASGSLPPGIPPDFFARVARTAEEMESRLILDTSGDALNSALEEGGIFLIKPNIGEMRAIAEKRLKTEEDVIEYARDLIDQGKVRVIIISIGSGGALMVTGEGCSKMRAPAVDIKSKVGAGDSMVAGTAYGLAAEKPLIEAVRYGIAAGAAAVMTPGTELCRGEDVERLYEQLHADAQPGH